MKDIIEHLENKKIENKPITNETQELSSKDEFECLNEIG